MTRGSAYARRKQGRKPRQLRRRILFVIELWVGVALLGVFGFRFYQYTQESDQFRVSTIRIEGLRVLSDDIVLAQSGLLDGGNVIYLDTEAVCTAVEELAYVRTCSLRQVFPDTVILEIVERVGIVTLQVNSRSFLMDEDGVVLRQYAEREVPLTPFVSNVPGLDFLEVGQVLEMPALRGALSVWEHFSRYPMASEVTVSELAAFSASEIVMYCDNLVFEIRWGNEDIGAQAERLNVLWVSETGALTCSEYLDLRFGEDLVCK